MVSLVPWSVSWSLLYPVSLEFWVFLVALVFGFIQFRFASVVFRKFSDGLLIEMHSYRPHCHCETADGYMQYSLSSQIQWQSP